MQECKLNFFPKCQCFCDKMQVHVPQAAVLVKIGMISNVKFTFFHKCKSFCDAEKCLFGDISMSVGYGLIKSLILQTIKSIN